MNNKVKNYKGLTLMETIINIYIYVLLILVCVTVSVAYIKSRSTIRQTQQAVEELSLTMNEMAKKIRMSSCVFTDPIWNDNRCIYFVYNTYGIGIKPNDGGANLEYQLNKDSHTLKVGGDLMMEDVGGEFSATNAGFGTDMIPLVTIKLWKFKKGTTTEIPGTRIQTSVSMRSGYSIE